MRRRSRRLKRDAKVGAAPEAAPCPHRPPCPGCPRYGEKGLHGPSARALADLAREAGLAAPALVEGPLFGYRHRARLAVRGRARSPKLGIFQQGSHRIVDIPSCPVHHPVINQVAAAVKYAVRATDTAPFAEAPHRGILRYVQVVIERSSQSAQLVLVANSDSPAACEAMAEVLRQQLGSALHSLWWNGNVERTNTILGERWQLLHGPQSVVESIAGLRVHYPPGAFGQANLDIADLLVERVGSFVADGESVLDLYTGCGVMGLSLLHRAARVAFNEHAPDGLRGLDLSLADLPKALRDRAHVHPGNVAELRDLRALCQSSDVIIVDPPRAGIADPVLRALEDAPPRRLIYVSCGLPSFLAQARRLMHEGQMKLISLEAYALFPNTEHVETLAVFEAHEARRCGG